MKRELGITVSIGISWNKIFAKLGSDYKKPDGITAFTKENYKELLWRLPAADLLYVGRSTRNTLNRYGIKTIGELALSDPKFLERLLGKNGSGALYFLQMDGMSRQYHPRDMKHLLNLLAIVPQLPGTWKITWMCRLY